MRRILIISGLAALALVSVVSLATLFVLHSSPGRQWIASIAEGAVAGVLGGDVEIGSLNGALPGHIILEDVSFRNEGDVWARVERAEARWRPFALLGGAIRIDSAALTGATLYGEPPQDPEPDDDEPFSISLPGALPDLAIGDLTIENFRSEIEGARTRLDGTGTVAMAGSRLDISVSLESENASDTVKIAAAIAPETNRVFIDARIESQPAGLISSLAELGGPLQVEVLADSPADAAEIDIDATIGAYGAVESIILANLENALSMNVDGVFTRGDALGDIEELADPVRFNFYVLDEPEGGRITINRLVTAAGALAGDIVWRGIRENANVFEADLRADFAEGYREEILRFLGPEATLAARLERREDDYGLDARLRGSELDVELAGGATNLRDQLRGDVAIDLAAQDDFPIGRTRLEASADFILDDSLSLRALKLSSDEGLTAQGDADYRFANDQLRFEGEINAEPAVVTALAPSVEPSGPLFAALMVEGEPERFTLNADIDAPSIRMGENEAPAINATIALAGLPRLPTGEIAARAAQGDGAFNATLRSSTDGRIALTNIDYGGEGFSLTGSGAYHPEAERGELDLTYQGAAAATPWPGVALNGSFTAKGDFARRGRATNLKIEAPALRANDVALEAFYLVAEGDPSAIAANIRAGRIAFGDGADAKDLKLAAEIRAGDDPRILLTAFESLIADNQATLAAPTTISFADGVVIDDARLKWGREGTIDLDAAFAETRWQGRTRLDKVNIPQSDGRLDLALNWDTAAERPADGRFTVRSLVGESEASIAGAVNWNGETLVLSNEAAGDELDMRIAIPARLTRTPGVGIETGGALEGALRYDGAIDPFAAFLPPDFQTIEGTLTADVDLSGTINAPALAGFVELSEGGYTEVRSGLSITGLHARADAQYADGASRIDIEGGARGGGQTGADTITFQGAVALAEEIDLSLDLVMNGATLSAFPVSSARVDGAIKASGRAGAIAASGDITVQELNAEIVTPEDTGLAAIEVVNIDDMQDIDLAPREPDDVIDFDIAINADDRIFVRGRGLESEWQANIRAVSEKGSPLILGSMTIRRGWLDFSGRRFDLTRGRITFDRLSANNPVLDIRAEFETSDGVTAAIVVSGRAQEPSIELVSTPPQPEEDIMALVLFGKPASELTAFESLQTAQALASLGGIGPFGGSGGLTGSLREATGLDLLNVDIDPESGGGSLTVGKYVADGLFVSATQDAQGRNGAVIVEYDITDNISVETELRQDGDQTVSANWKKDF
ncbi:MAG: translocation/assembly module TamB domain-containing protein [Pseudomonadota bacterium]